MSKQDVREAAQETDAPRAWNEESIELLMRQFRFMLEHEVRNMKLEVIENIGAMLARRSGVDREIHDLTARVDLLAKAIEDFGARLAIIEKGEPRPASRDPHSRMRDLTRIGVVAPSPAQEAPGILPPPSKGKKIGRPPGKGAYEVYNARKRAKQAGGTS